MAFIEKPHHHKNARAVLALIVVLLAVGILILFVNNQDSIVESNSLQPFIILAAIGLGLLAGLVFLANKDHKVKSSIKQVVRSKASRNTKKKKRSR